MKKIKFFITLALATIFLSCGRSPILNHSEAKDGNPTQNIEQAQATNAECPLDFPKAGLCASLTWTSHPVLKKKQPGSFVVKFWDKQTGSAEKGPYVNPPHAVDAVMWMPSMGHGSWITGITSVQAGVFDVTNVFFIMKGEWEIRIQLYEGPRDDDDKKIIHEQAALNLTVNG